MLKVVSNTTPIISLLKLERLDLLQQLYSKVYIPKAVYKEIEAGKQKGYYLDLANIDWVHIVEVQNQQTVKNFHDLDAGEAEAIVLATELKADLLIIDESLGRAHAKRSGLKITGTIGILLKAKAAGKIELLKPLLKELSHKRVWISEKLIKEVLARANEV